MGKPSRKRKSRAQRKALRIAPARKAAAVPRRPVRRDVKVKTKEDRLCWKLVGLVCFAVAVLVGMALVSFDWECVASLCAKPRPQTNLVGYLGNQFAYCGYMAFGFAIWFLPLALILGGLKLLEPIPADVEEIPNGRVVRRVAGFALMLLVATGLIQLAGRWQWVGDMMAQLHIGGNAGGWVGRAFMTCGLERWIATTGALFVSVVLLAAAVCMAVGLGTLRKMFEPGEKPPPGPEPGQADAPRPTIGDAIREVAKALGKRRPGNDDRERTPQSVHPPRRGTTKAPTNGKLPPITLLDPVPPRKERDKGAEETGEKLMETLKEFGVQAELSYMVSGPVVTQYAITPARGVRVERITGLAKDLQRSLKAKAIRIFAPIPGEDTVGVEIPNKVRETVSFREIVESAEWQDNAAWPRNGAPRIPVPLLFGKNVKGEEEIGDLTKMPHLLVAGASGMGKSVGLNAIIGGLLMSRTPEQLRLVLVDPKGGMEFAKYARLPHLLVPVVTEIKGVVAALKWAAKEMARRQAVLAEAGCRDIRDYNVRTKELMPYIVVVIDELADIMTLAGRDVEPVLGRLMALARATGIHLILATQRPDVKVISGTIKANIPGRVAFATTTATDSRTILDEAGAENLIGDGDMLVKRKRGLSRAQGAFIGDAERDRIIDFTARQWPATIDETLLHEIEHADDDADDGGKEDGGEDGVTEGEYARARAIVIEANRASISMIQQRMGVGYNHASRIINLLEKRGMIGPHHGAGPREVLAVD